MEKSLCYIKTRVIVLKVVLVTLLENTIQVEGEFLYEIYFIVVLYL
ncbi:hypothetical protein P4308_02085 [Bacillus wiedmannii]|nr:hypothetical protein [Bacillus wiedmannii]MBZ4221809.1 hypothetical protein [Bacillus wiedmannii]MED2930975.1 hypothetical protein [Bacillus wiedmannii]